jgi:hypothetical protein
MSWKIAVASQLILLALVFHGQASASSTPSPTCVVPPTGLISWWTGDVDTTDLYGVNDPSAVNAVSLVPGELLHGFTFGTGGYIDIPASPTLANQKFTWDAWVEPDGPGPNDDNYGSIIIDQAIDDTDSSVELAWRATDNRFLFVFGNIDSEIIVSNDTFPTGTFYLLAATYDGATVRLYVNGVLEGSFAEKKKIAYSSSTWEIGSTDAHFRAEGYPRTWNGVIDEVEAFKVALPASKILSIFKAGSAGKCKAPVIVTPSTEKFAPQTVGTTSLAKAVTIINNRDVTLTINPFTFTGADPLDFGDPSTTCGGTLAARKSCKVDVTFTPQEAGSRSAVLNVNDSDGGSPQTVSLNSVGLASGPNVTLSPTSLTFGNQTVGTTSPAQSITLSNFGSTTLSITSITASSNFGQTNTCNSTLAPGASCTVSVTFTPGHTGSLNGTLSCADSAADSPQTVALSGTGVAQPYSGRCLVGSGNTLTGYCIGTRGGVCRHAYDPTNCPVGQPPTGVTSDQCGISGTFNVDASRSCIP